MTYHIHSVYFNVRHIFVLVGMYILRAYTMHTHAHKYTQAKKKTTNTNYLIANEQKKVIVLEMCEIRRTFSHSQSSI